MVGRLLCFLIVGIQASGISIPLSSIEIAESTSIETEIEIEIGIEIEIAEPTSIEIAESKFQKLGYLRSESTTADQPQKRTCEGTTSNSRNNNEDRNAPIAANHHATNSDT